MPPLQTVGDFPGMEGSSLLLDKRDLFSNDAPSSDVLELSRRTASSPMEVFKTLNARSEPTKPVVGGQGAIDPHDINMQGLMALFAIIGAAFVLAAIWFFFWAKNGGFVWRKGDWEEYKSTVLRRKGPDGRTLSNATPSTKLGGGSVVDSRFRDDVTDAGMTYTDAETTVTDEKHPPRKKRGFRERFLRMREEKPWEGGEDEAVRAYREEKSARVGGINREAEGTYHGSDYTSTNPSSHPSDYNQSEVSQTRDFAYRDNVDNHQGVVTQARNLWAKTYHDRDNHDNYETNGNGNSNGNGNGAQQNRNASNFSFTAGSEDVLSRTTEDPPSRDTTSSRRDREPYREHRRDHRRRDRDRDRDRERRHRSSRAPSSRPSSRPSSTTRHHRRERSSARGSGGGRYTDPLDFTSSSAPTNSEYQYSAVGTEETSSTPNKSYHRPIPSLSKGYRRDPGSRRRRRDSLSDSDGEESRITESRMIRRS